MAAPQTFKKLYLPLGRVSQVFVFILISLSKVSLPLSKIR
jgi:hypothetical protein